MYRNSQKKTRNQKPLVIQAIKECSTQAKKTKTRQKEWKDRIRERQSMGQRCIESFHSLIKREWINFYHFLTMERSEEAVFEYIEGFLQYDPENPFSLWIRIPDGNLANIEKRCV
ncbi:IS3 family transposase [Dubosiella newyorkensis]|uniref:IS3 family transposase n=1 Tax=Dubosiella newyorkensis TaxID=1862672 RepID=UPI003F6794B7